MPRRRPIDVNASDLLLNYHDFDTLHQALDRAKELQSVFDLRNWQSLTVFALTYLREFDRLRRVELLEWHERCVDLANGFAAQLIWK